MSKKLTISVSDEVYEGLHRKVGRRRISQFLEKLARPHVLPEDIETAYRDMAADEDREREATSLGTPVAGQVRRLGFMAGQIVVPGDLDRVGGPHCCGTRHGSGLRSILGIGRLDDGESRLVTMPRRGEHPRQSQWRMAFPGQPDARSARL